VRVRGWKTRRRKEPERWDPSGEHHRPTMIFCERFESEHACWDPKDGELCVRRVKSGETLMEARRDTDVQIVLMTCV